MLNLSDKELDRLAREAANEYDPGDLTGPGSWDRMQLRLDTEMGSPRFNPFRSFRRMSFYYAPAAIMLLAGATWFLLRPTRNHSSTHPPGSPAMAQAEPSGGPPAKAADPTRPEPANSDGSIKNQNSSYSPTSTQPSVSSASGATPDHDAAYSSTGAASASPGTASSSIRGASSSGRIASPATRPTGTVTYPGTVASSNQPAADGLGATHAPALNSNRPHHHRNRQGSSGSIPGSGNIPVAGSNPGSAASSVPLSSMPSMTSSSAATASPGSLSYSVVAGLPSDMPSTPVIDDALLRKSVSATTAKAAEPVNPGKRASQSMRINRRLQLGLSVSPDFASVNSLAGDKPGSDIGITISYQFFSRFHLQTGFLLAHRIYTAAQEDYHVPHDYYRMNNMHDVYFVKGNINLYEIPLNLRYDFSVTGNTSFFVSGGVSSYLLTHENCNYYFDLFGRNVYQEFQYGNHQNSLFGTVNLSMGVETGLTNSLSLMIAPYFKVPTSGLGFGKIEMNSVGVEFGLKYAPVLRRKRH